MEDFFWDFFGRIEYCVPVRTTNFQTDRRKNQLVMMVQRACLCACQLAVWASGPFLSDARVGGRRARAPRRPWQSYTLTLVCCASAASAHPCGRSCEGRPLRASYVPALAVLRHPTSSLSPCAPAHARRRRRRPGWSTWPRSASRPTNQRRSAVRCARAFRTLDFYCNRNAHSRPGPNMARPLVSCDGSPRGVPFSGAIVPSLSLSLSRSLSFAD